MFHTVTLLGLVSQVPYVVSVFRTCIPNTQFQMNGHICYCDGLGRWSDADCEINRRKKCQPGQIIWENCNQCICQENGHLQCIITACGEDKTAAQRTASKELDVTNVWCLPFVSYYLNCSLCVCPASGKISEARCAKDASCPFEGIKDFSEAVKKNVCIPKVMYLFPCLQCHCSDEGFFNIDKCAETCRKPQTDSSIKCIPNTFYRRECNICWCPKNSGVKEEMCTKNICNRRFELYSLDSLMNRTSRCHRNTFTSPKCFFCECNQDGTADKKSCLESDCMDIEDQKHTLVKNKCSSGEMVPLCTECLCLRNGLTDPRYCTKLCSDQQKLIVLAMVIKESLTNHMLIDTGAIQKSVSNDACEPNTIYLDEGKYCLCPDNGNTKIKLCTSFDEQTGAEREKVDSIRGASATGIDFTVPCEPSTFVEFDCNTCYCLKSGRLDPKWCTYDDCEAKLIIQKRHKIPDDVVEFNEVCVPGSITKDKCNFCICPENGQLKDKACTKNSCAGLRVSSYRDKFSCEPLVYFNVDCNTCYCPKNGVKNVAKCTKNTCEKNFLRTDVCVPGSLFSEVCNVCVCPTNGDKSDRVCTNHICADDEAPWKKIFKLSQSLSSNHLVGDMTRNLELCFPGEEFELGCKVCVCPDMGLRIYATCINMLCGDQNQDKETQSDVDTSKIAHSRIRRDGQSCISYKLTDSSERKECTPGSMYIIRCRQCICPYLGNINLFCRPLPKDTYCEQAFPGFNYMPMGRRKKENATASLSVSNTITIKHNHTTHVCSKPGKVIDECFICECESSDHQNVIIEEHCFKSDNATCGGRTPSFLDTNLTNK